MVTEKRKDQQKKASANYRVKIKQHIAELLETIEQLKNEIEKYKK